MAIQKRDFRSEKSLGDNKNTRIEQRGNVVVVNGLEISGTIQQNQKCYTVNILSFMMTPLIVIFAQAVMSG